MEKLIAAIAALAIVVGVYAVGTAVGSPSSSSSSVSATATSPTTTAGQVVTAGSVATSSAHDHSDATVDDRGFALLQNGEQHTHTFTQAVSPADRVLLAHQLELARQVALQYPTVADAEKAGLRRAGPFSPGLGAHYISFAGAVGNGDGVMDDNDIRHPLAWIYDGTHPNSRIAGLFYMTSNTNPQGFAGPNDQWHVHHNICIKTDNGVVDAPLGADNDVTDAQCNAVGGHLLKQTELLLHVWVVPGYESPEGVFSHLSSAITCDDGTYHVIDTTKTGARTTICVDGSE